jgi:hypothetical protein
MSNPTGSTGYTGSGYVEGNYPEGTYTPEAMKGLADRCCDEVAGCVDRNPAGALLTAFGAGVGIGLALALTVALPKPKPKRRNLPEELGHKVLAALQDILPDSVAKRMG